MADNRPDGYAELLALQRAEFKTAFLPALRRLRWSADRLAAERERRLRELLAWSVENSPFHAERLGGIDVSRFTEEDLPSLPIMTRDDLMGNFDDVVTDRALTLEMVNAHVDAVEEQDHYLLGQYRVVATSGTTGARVLFVYGWRDWIDFALIATRWPASEGGASHPTPLSPRCSRLTPSTCRARFTPSSPTFPVRGRCG